jgi:hypothetical protein
MIEEITRSFKSLNLLIPFCGTYYVTQSMPGLTMQYSWHIGNQNTVLQISCVEGIPSEYCGGSFSLISLMSI